MTTRGLAEELDKNTIDFYLRTMDALDGAGIGFLVGGAWAFEAHTGIGGRTKDLDLFVRPEDVEAAMAALDDMGSRTELTSPLWIGKAFHHDEVVDLIFSSGNGLCTVDDAWFEHAVRSTVLDRPVGLVPIEEMIWSKSFLMERDRFDGADIQHLVLAANGALDADRLLARFGVHWRVLLAQVVLFDYAFPSKRGLLPEALRTALMERATSAGEAVEVEDERDLCYGTFLSRHQYIVDVEDGAFIDARHA
jgi:aminoglycoside-2''-adenylyltransferase